MNKWTTRTLTIFSMFFLSQCVPLRAEESTTPTGEVALPWSQFEKLLGLNRDTIELSWEEFQRLCRLAGSDSMPAHQMQNGRVVLSRAEFKSLLERLRTPSEEWKAYLTTAVYSGTVGKKSTQVLARFRLQITGRPDASAPLRVPLFPGTMAYQDVLWDGRPAVIENENGRLIVLATQAGDHEVSVRFSIAHGLDKAPQPLSFQGPDTPITELDFTIPLPNVGVNVAGASFVETTSQGSSSRVRAALPAGQPISMSWSPVEPAKTKGPAKVYAVIHQLLSVEEDALRVKAQVELQVLQNAVNTISLKVPAGFTVLDVQGEAIGEWSVRGEEAKVLVVPFTYAREGKLFFTISAEQGLKEKGGAMSYSGFQALETVRENGFLGIEIRTTAEAKLLDQSGIDRLDVQELPSALSGMAQRPILYGFRYVRQPYNLNVEIQRHEAVAVVSTVIDRASAVTLALADGKRVTNVTYSVRNTWKQFLELKLPKGAVLWSAFVEGRPVRPSQNEKGKILIPLNRSSGSGGNLTSFDVEILYFQNGWRFLPVGALRADVPVPDVVVSQALWSVYVPENYDYLVFGGNVDKEARARGIAPVARAIFGGKQILRNMAPQSIASSIGDYRASKNARLEQAKASDQWGGRGDFDKSAGVDEGVYAQQIERELNFFDRVSEQSGVAASTPGDAGVLPIRIAVPNTGVVYRFTKRILVDETPLQLWTVFIHSGTLKLLVLAILFFGVRFLMRYRARAEGIMGQASAWMARHGSTLRVATTPAGAVLSVGLLTAVAFVISRWLGSLLLVLWLASLGRWVWASVNRQESR